MTDKPIRVWQMHRADGVPLYHISVCGDYYAVCSEPHLNHWLWRAWAHAQWHMGLTGTRGVE